MVRLGGGEEMALPLRDLPVRAGVHRVLVTMGTTEEAWQVDVGEQEWVNLEVRKNEVK
jgi:hypothetical protein